MRRDLLLAILRQKRTFAGMKMPFVFLVVLLVILVASSVVEQVAGTAAALTWGYTAPWTLVLWGLTAVSGGVAVWRSRRHTAAATRCLHGALLVILAGALATHLGGEDGELSLARQSAPPDRYLTDGRHVRHLPFSVRAIDFGTVRRADGAFTRFDEVHTQYVYEAEEICAALDKAGFEVLLAEGMYGEDGNLADRLCFLAKKK